MEQGSLFDALAPEPPLAKENKELPIDFFIAPKQGILVTPPALQRPTLDDLVLEPFGNLISWLTRHGYENILCECVLRAKTIEANRLHNAGWQAELQYLIEYYDGDENALRGAVFEIAKFLKRTGIKPADNLVTTAT